jgi:hypothetical protein
MSNNRKRIGALEKELDEKRVRISDLEKPAFPTPESPKPGPVSTSTGEPPKSTP